MRISGHVKWPMVVVVPAVLVLAAVVSWPQYRQQRPMVSTVDTPAVGHWETTDLRDGINTRPDVSVDATEYPSDEGELRAYTSGDLTRESVCVAPPSIDRQVFGPLAEDPLLVSSTDPQLPATSPPVTRSTVDDELCTETEPSSDVLSRGEWVRVPDIATCWPLPQAVLDSLQDLRAANVATAWADDVERCLRQLHASSELGSDVSLRQLDRLSTLTAAAGGLAAAESQSDRRNAMLRTVYSLERRLTIWRGVHLLSRPSTTPVVLTSAPRGEPVIVTTHLSAVEAEVARLVNADTWRKYLLLDEVRALHASPSNISVKQRSLLAREILLRLERANESPEQVQFFTATVWQSFAMELRQWVAEPIDYERLLDGVESLEETGAERAAMDVAECYQVMRWSASPSVVQLAEQLNTYYRNANVRVAISADLINRLLPNEQTTDENVDDYLMGGRILGRSRVSTRLKLVLVPDREQWKMGLEAQGEVDSQTEAKRGPAVFHNAGRAHYLARKLLTLDGRGLRTQDAEAAAISDADLTKLETDLDGVPLVNWLVRAIARQQYDSQADTAKWQAEGLLASKAQTRLDAEVEKQLKQSTDKFRKQILEPLQDLGLRPEAVDMETTAERLIARYRLAGYRQMAAYSPRPQATSDSLLSLQIHETALNNVMASLQLGGKETDLPTLFQEIARRFRRDDAKVPEDIPTDVKIQLADQDAIRFSFADDRVHLTLRIKRLDAGEPNVWRDIEVRATYMPDLTGLHVGLVRDGHIRLKGRRLAMRDQVALRGIFSRVLAQHPDIDLLGNVLVRDRRLHDLRVSQCVLRDGWIGLSVGAGEPVKVRMADSADKKSKG
jgi:hypothetical protein